MDPAAKPAMLGEFRIDAVLGQGGSGIVYAATWGPRRVALKVLHPSLVGTGKERAQFFTEAQRLQQITHPAVVKVFAAGELPDGRPYLAMERLEGETLAQVIARGRLPLDRAVPLFDELCAAVAALHAQGLVHRDLKPENVFVVEDRHVVLLDFGIAKALDAPASTTTQEGNVRGTPAYMAPERFFGQPAGLATDLYELALVLYVMLAGRLPWDDVADPEARLAPRPLVELAPVPEPLDIEVRRALSTRAQNRPASASALHAAVHAALEAAGEAIEPNVTARMRPAVEDSAPEGAGPARAPSDRAATPADGATLSSAPRVATSTVRARRRWPWIAGAGIGVAIAGALVLSRAGAKVGSSERSIKPIDAGSVGSQTFVASGHDPWRGAPADEPTKALPLVAPKLTLDAYRAESLAAVQRLPADTRFVFTVQIAELRAQQHTATLLDKLAKWPKVTEAAVLLPPCVKALAADAEWIVFGAPSVAHAMAGTLVVRGRWRRGDVEACLGDSVKPNVTHDQARVVRIGELGWLDFLDDHTAYITMNTALEAEAVHALVRRGAGPQPHARDILAALPADRSMAIVADGHASDDWSSVLAIPKGSDVVGWVRVEPAGLTMDLAADTHDEKAAKAAEGQLRPQIDQVWATASPEMAGKLEVVRQRTVVHLRGNITALMLGIVSASLSQ